MEKLQRPHRVALTAGGAIVGIDGARGGLDARQIMSTPNLPATAS